MATMTGKLQNSEKKRLAYLYTSDSNAALDMLDRNVLGTKAFNLPPPVSKRRQ